MCAPRGKEPNALFVGKRVGGRADAPGAAIPSSHPLRPSLLTLRSASCAWSGRREADFLVTPIPPPVSPLPQPGSLGSTVRGNSAAAGPLLMTPGALEGAPSGLCSLEVKGDSFLQAAP